MLRILKNIAVNTKIAQLKINGRVIDEPKLIFL